MALCPFTQHTHTKNVFDPSHILGVGESMMRKTLVHSGGTEVRLSSRMGMCGDPDPRGEAPQPRGQEGFLREGTGELRLEAGVGTVTPNISIDGIRYLTNYPRILWL